ncbi:S-layer homology domain-containing protein [Paenibacillus xanthanilyticus]|uniref:S-layer homology domain-containing protein n=1 Tax=Paenibacillus xanthanilyticus TaxID=1783531 RepID=A0ABV8JXC3_9BACL
MNKAMLKKTAVASMAVLTLAGGATSAFADGKGKGNDRKDDDRKSGYSQKKEEYNINVNFKDEKELKWALEYIVRLASKGVFTGYEDGTFKPNKVITRIEAITAAVRLMGLKEQAESAEEMATVLNFKDASELKKKYPWAVGYVAVALEKDLFNETDTSIQAEKPATRLFAATLLIKALGLDAEAKAKVNTSLNFRDAKNIPAASVGYVALAVEKGLITGYNDNTFRPNQPVTRAELAALLDRTDEQMPDDDQDAQAISGKLKAAAADGKITIVKSDNTETTVSLASHVFVFRNNVKASVTSLVAGDEIVVRTFGGSAVFIEVTKPAESTVADASYAGKLKAGVSNNSITLVKADNSEVVIPLSSGAYIFRNNVKVAASALVAGDEIVVQVSGGKAVFIEVTKTAVQTPADQTYNGTLKAAVSGDSLTLVKADKSEIAIPIDSNAYIFRNNVKVAASALVAGDQITVSVANGKAVFIEVTKTFEQQPVEATYTGKLKAAVSNNTITVIKADNTEVAIPLSSNAYIFRNDVKVAASALVAGDELLVRTYQGKAVFVEVTKNYVPQVVTQTGKLNSVSLGADGKINMISITQEIAGGTQALVLNVASNVTIVGDSAKLVAGATVELKVTNNAVTSIEVKA